MNSARIQERRAALFAKEAIADFHCAMRHGLELTARFAAIRAQEHAATMLAARAIADRKDKAAAYRNQERVLRAYVFA